jgi:hypothetical protein
MPHFGTKKLKGIFKVICFADWVIPWSDIQYVDIVYLEGKNFMNVFWLIAEAYIYRRLHNASASVSSGVTTTSIIDIRCARLCHLLILGQCDTSSRSKDAVFELTLRFADPFKILERLSHTEELEAERLMFLELSQGQKTVYHFFLVFPDLLFSLSLGPLNRPFPLD